MLQRIETVPVEAKRPHSISPFLLGVGDFFLLNISFFVLNWWKRGGLDLSPVYLKLLLTSYLIWFVVALLTKKFRISSYKGYWDAIFVFARSGVYAVYLVSFVVVLMGLPGFSRLHVFGIWCLLVMQEGMIFSLYYVAVGERQRSAVRRQMSERYSFSKFLLVSDFVLVGFAFVIVTYLKTGHFHPLERNETLLLAIYGVWFICSIVTRKFDKRYYQNYYHAIWPWLKTAILMVFLMSMIVFAFRLFYLSRIQAFGSILMLVVFEAVFYRVYFKSSRGGQAERDVQSGDQLKSVLKQDELPLEGDLEELRRHLFEPVRKTLKEGYLKNQPDFFHFLDQSIELTEIVRAEMTIRNNHELVHLDMSTCRPVRLFINLKRINGVGWINGYFHEVHKMLLSRGYFAGSSHTITAHRKGIFEKYPKYIAYCVYVADFILNRFTPKLPYIKRLYLAFTKGRHKVISRAQLLGRLCFCGFEIVAEKEIDGRLCFVAGKAKTPSLDQSPSYGPLVELKRVGSDNEVLHIYKFRTMHPYSEFLQDYVYEKGGLRQGGKLGNDFRVTEWGKVMRKLWLDELPMLYNWVRGDLRLFGVRPLSPHYLSLYPQDLKELRRKVKPGLVPPFYTDMPETFDEICASERRYIEAYLKRPFRTQWVYFWKAFDNIVFKGARSR